MYQSDLCTALNDIGWFRPGFVEKYAEGLEALGLKQGPGATPLTETQIGWAMWWALMQLADAGQL